MKHLTIYIWQKKGFLGNIRKIDKLGIADQRNLETYLGMTADTTESQDEATEAFGRALVAFSFMPEYATNDLLPKGFSRRGLLAPPVTTTEFSERLGELSSYMMAIGFKKLDPDTLRYLSNQALVRVYWFFQTAKELPIHLEETEREKREIAIGRFEDMLGDVRIELP